MHAFSVEKRIWNSARLRGKEGRPISSPDTTYGGLLSQPDRHKGDFWDLASYRLRCARLAARGRSAFLAMQGQV